MFLLVPEVWVRHLPGPAAVHGAGPAWLLLQVGRHEERGLKSTRERHSSARSRLGSCRCPLLNNTTQRKEEPKTLIFSFKIKLLAP